MKQINGVRWAKLGLAVTASLVLLTFLFAGISSNETVTGFIEVLIFFYLILVVGRALFFFAGTFLQKLESSRLDRSSQRNPLRPLVTIIMPCFNEQKVVEVSLQSLLKLEYHPLEVILVNDGSLDLTELIARNQAQTSLHAAVKVLHQANQGKARALNLGLTHASGDLILCVDADSRLNPDALEWGIRHFQDPQVGAVAGFVEIANQDNILLLLQQLEYLVGLNFNRRALSFLGTVPIVPGPAGLFRREAILRVGGFLSDRHVFAEDAELSLRLLTQGWKIKTEDQMIAYTEAPADHRSLLRQRYRWNRGTYQALLVNWFPLVRSGWRGRGVAGYLFLETVVTPVLNFGLILFFLSYYFRTGEQGMFTFWYFYLLGVDVLTSTLATFRHGGFFRWWALTLFNKVYYFYMLLTWRLFALYDEWFSTEMGWDKLERQKDSLREVSA